MKSLIFIAPPAAGKGTQSDLFKTKFGYIHISTGDLLRQSMNDENEIFKKIKEIMEKGELVPDDIIIKLIENKFYELVGKSFILDGFPRTLNQAIALDKLLNQENIEYLVVYINLDLDSAIERMKNRIVCSCGKSYNLAHENLKPKVENVCDSCGKQLTKRNDDNIDTFKNRYDTFIKNNEELLKYYSNKNKLFEVSALDNYDVVFEKIVNEVNK